MFKDRTPLLLWIPCLLQWFITVPARPHMIVKDIKKQSAVNLSLFSFILTTLHFCIEQGNWLQNGFITCMSTYFVNKGRQQKIVLDLTHQTPIERSCSPSSSLSVLTIVVFGDSVLMADVITSKFCIIPRIKGVKGNFTQLNI